MLAWSISSLVIFNFDINQYAKGGLDTPCPVVFVLLLPVLEKALYSPSYAAVFRRSSPALLNKHMLYSSVCYLKARSTIGVGQFLAG
jgi:hypothetical protein